LDEAMLNSFIEHTTLRLLDQEYNPYPKNISLYDFEKLRETCLAGQSQESLLVHPDEFKGYFIFQIDETNLEDICNNSELTKSDISELQQWLFSSTKRKYTLDYYKLETPTHILLFTVFYVNNIKVMYGFIFNNSIQAKVDLIQFKQNNLMRDFI